MRLCFVLLLAACGGAAATTPPPAAPRPAPPLFSFHVGFWINLHERLYAESSPRARPGAAEPATPEWTAAVDAYRRRFPERTIRSVFAPELMTLRAALSATADDAAEPAGVEPELAATLRAAAGRYRSGGWEADRRQSEAFVAGLQPLLAAHGRALADELSRLLQVPWPDAPMLVEVSAFAGPVGAFTSHHPARIAIAAADPRISGTAALETLFHEATHVLSLTTARGIESAAEAQSRRTPPDLWHALLFFTTGEVVARRVGGGYVPYAVKNGLYQRAPGWSGYEAALRSAWLPYIDGKVTMEVALADLVRAVPGS